MKINRRVVAWILLAPTFASMIVPILVMIGGDQDQETGDAGEDSTPIVPLTLSVNTDVKYMKCVVYNEQKQGFLPLAMMTLPLDTQEADDLKSRFEQACFISSGESQNGWPNLTSPETAFQDFLARGDVYSCISSNQILSLVIYPPTITDASKAFWEYTIRSNCDSLKDQGGTLRFDEQINRVSTLPQNSYTQVSRAQPMKPTV